MPTLALPGLELHHEETGRGAPLVLLHGLGASGADWAPQLAAFRDRFRVITLDARGSGKTRDLQRPRGPFSIPQLAADARAALEQLGATPAHVVGWSMGGMIALQLAVDAPQLVGSRVLAPKLFPKPEQAALRREYVARMAANDKRAYAALLAAIVGWSVADRLDRLTMPVLAIASEGDYTSVASKEAWVRRLSAGRLVVIPDARHALPMEAPDWLNAAIAEFLDGLPALRGTASG